jgi:hypothetical protein
MKESEVMCCIADCDRYGVIEYLGKLYCRFHADEAKAENKDDCIGCDLCTSEPKCCVEGCDKPGIISEVCSGNVVKTYCVTHAWKIDRPDENGLVHPNKGRWNAEDTLRAHGEGIDVDKEKLPAVSETIYEQCVREMEEGRKSGWKIRREHGK